MAGAARTLTRQSTGASSGGPGPHQGMRRSEPPSPHPPRVEGRLNRDSRGSVVPRRVGQLATRQRGVASHAQLLELDVSSDQIDRWLAAGRLIALHEGVYAVGHAAPVAGAQLLSAV